MGGLTSELHCGVGNSCLLFAYYMSLYLYSDLHPTTGDLT